MAEKNLPDIAAAEIADVAPNTAALSANLKGSFNALLRHPKPLLAFVCVVGIAIVAGRRRRGLFR